MTAARFPIKQASIAAVISGLDKIQNSGTAAMMNLLKQRVKVLEDTFWNQMSAAVYSDGSGYSGKQMNGLSLIISKAPTSGLMGGIDRSQQVWWQNYAVNANTDTRGVITAANIQSYMNSITINLKRNSDGTDLIVADNTTYLAYLSSLQTIQRITEDRGDHAAGIGFTALKYYGAGKSVDVILDGGKGGQIPPNTMYFINSDNLHFRPAANANFVVTGGDRQNVNQDAIVRIMTWAGNMTCSNSSLQGVLFQ